jgi:hypothetical protein
MVSEMGLEDTPHEPLSVITAAHLHAELRVLQHRMSVLEERFNSHMTFLRSAFIATFVLALGGFGTVTWAIIRHGLN